ncbi:uncharacterized protein [Panulirus ornatus]|uniref:uncharacterized protein n=1 Tax=Panulirus ornatus TaxID=150431 RepID=UPI003A83DBB8
MFLAGCGSIRLDYIGLEYITFLIILDYIGLEYITVLNIRVCRMWQQVDDNAPGILVDHGNNTGTWDPRLSGRGSAESAAVPREKRETTLDSPDVLLDVVGPPPTWILSHPPPTWILSHPPPTWILSHPPPTWILSHQHIQWSSREIPIRQREPMTCPCTAMAGPVPSVLTKAGPVPSVLANARPVPSVMWGRGGGHFFSHRLGVVWLFLCVVAHVATAFLQETGALCPEQEASPFPQEAPYGTWKSPISSEVVTEAVNEIVEAPQVDPVTGYVFWCEQLSNESRRNGVFHFNPETRERIRWTSTEYDVRTWVHGYGGGAFTIYNNTLFFSHGGDNAIYRQDGPSGTPRRLSNTTNKMYADGFYYPQEGQILYVAEDHSVQELGTAKEPQNTLVMMDATTGAETVLAHNADFFAAPRLSPDGSLITWIQWDHPHMPWGDTQLSVGEMNSNGEVKIVFTFHNGSIMMPSLDRNNNLYYVHDNTGWWNLYRLVNLTDQVNLTPQAREVGWPAWIFGTSAYDVNPESNEVVFISHGELMVLDLGTRESRVLDTGYSTYKLGVVYSKDGTKVYVVAGDATRAERLIEVELSTGEVQVVNEVNDTAIHPEYISVPTDIQFPTSHGDTAYGYLYMPRNKDYYAPSEDKPPLLVRVHGGPTSEASTILRLDHQFYTSRGFAILDVNYRGSTGYGTEYRNKLNGQWGVFDVDDVLAGATYLVKEGLVDEKKICIGGGSAGGFTTLAALTTDKSIFAAGASVCGISDLELLVRDTHKFESHYIDYLVGSIDTEKQLYEARSPLTNAEKLQTPIIFFQGSIDKIVPPNQAKLMFEKVKSKGIPSAHILYEGEGHQFLLPENLRSSLEAEVYFFSQILDINLSDVTSNLTIHNLDTWRTNHKQLKTAVNQ